MSRLRTSDEIGSASARARRSDSLYYADVSRRNLCDQIARLEVEVQVARDREEYWHDVAHHMANVASRTGGDGGGTVQGQ